MKDKIRDILSEHINMSTNRPGPLADELTALMCYREVRAIGEWIGVEYLFLEDHYDCLIDQLSKYYPKGAILQAIEQVKKQMK
jgi:hypothetical protein